AIAWLLLDELIDLQHLVGQSCNWLHAFKVVKLGSGRQAGNGERTDLSLQVWRRQAGTFMLRRHFGGTQGRRRQKDQRQYSFEALEMPRFCHVNVYLRSV